MRYGVSSSITCDTLSPRVRQVCSRIRALNVSRAFGAMRRSRHRTLRLVDLQPQLRGQEPAHRGHDPFAGALTANIDVAVVGVPAEAVTTAGQLLVEIVEEEVA